MEERDLIISLYDIYGELFNGEQRNIFENYYFEDKSLSEISDEICKSRNAIHKSLKSVGVKLLEYEKVLKIYEKRIKLINLLNLIDDNKIKSLLEDIL